MNSITTPGPGADDVRLALGRLDVTPEEVGYALQRDMPAATAGWLVGSLALGRGNARSDIDAILVNVIDEEDTARLVPVTAVQGQRVDVRCVRPEWVAAIADAARRVATGTARPGDEALIGPEHQLTLFARIAYGYALPGYHDPRVELGVDRSAATVVLVRADLVRIQRLWLLGALAVRAGRDLMLVDTATTIVETILHAAATARCGYVSSPKWIWEISTEVAADLVVPASDALALGRSPAERWAAARHLYRTVIGADSPERFRLVTPGAAAIRFGERWVVIDPATGRRAWLPPGRDDRIVERLRSGLDLVADDLDADFAAALLAVLAVSPLDRPPARDPLYVAQQLVGVR
jgi:hypothetical protein